MSVSAMPTGRALPVIACLTAPSEDERWKARTTIPAAMASVAGIGMTASISRRTPTRLTTRIRSSRGSAIALTDERDPRDDPEVDVPRRGAEDGAPRAR